MNSVAKLRHERKRPSGLRLIWVKHKRVESFFTGSGLLSSPPSASTLVWSGCVCPDDPGSHVVWGHHAPGRVSPGRQVRGDRPDEGWVMASGTQLLEGTGPSATLDLARMGDGVLV